MFADFYNNIMHPNTQGCYSTQVTASLGDIRCFSKKKKKGAAAQEGSGRGSGTDALFNSGGLSCQSLWYIVAVVTHLQGFRLPRSFLDVVLGRGT